MNTQIKENILKISFLLITIEGYISLFFYFSIRSMPRNAWILGYSKSKLLLGLLFLLTMIALTVVTIRFYKNGEWIKKFLQKTEALSARAIYSIFFLAVYILITIIVLWLFKQSSIGYSLPNIITALFERSGAVVFWIALFQIHLLVLLVVLNPAEFLAGLKDNPASRTYLLAFVIMLATSYQWGILLFQLPVFQQIPGWFWKLNILDYGSKELLFLLASVLILLTARQILSNPEQRRLNFSLLLLSGLAIQIVFGYIRGSGFESVRLKYISSQQSIIALESCGQEDITTAIREYDALFGSDPFPGTKPPGMLAFFMGSDKLISSLGLKSDPNACFSAITKAGAALFPIISLSTLALILYFGKTIAAEKSATLAGLFYITLPSFSQFTLFQDQFLFTPLFLACLIVFYKSLKTRSFIIAAAAGILIYIAIFFSFSLLPLIGLIGIWLLGDIFINQAKKQLASYLNIVFGLTAGFLTTAFGFYIQFQYNPLSRYLSAIDLHRRVKGFSSGIEQLFQAVFLNNLEFLLLIGIPVGFVFTKAVIKLVSNKKLFANNPDYTTLTLSFFGMCLILNIIGQTKGEVGRIWLFLTPMICIVAGNDLEEQMKTKPWFPYLILTLQLMTVFLTFKFQDYGCRLC